MFKILFKPIKWILTIVLSTVILIAIPFVLMYKSVTPPDVDENEINLESIITDNLDSLIDKNNTDKRIEFLVSADTANFEIYNQFVKEFGESVTDDYVYVEDRLMLQGAWINFEKDTIRFIAGAHVDAEILTYKTAIELGFKLVSEEDGIATLSLSRLKIGNLSLRWVLRYSPGLIKTLTGYDLEQIVADTVGDFGTFDIKKLELKVNLYDLAETMEENKDLITMLLDIIYEHELIEFGVLENGEDYEIGVKLNLNPLYEEVDESKLLNPNDRFADEDAFNDFLYNKGLSAAMSTNNHIKFNQKEMNRIIEYILRQSGDLANNYLMKQNLYEDYDITILNPYVDFVSDKMRINVPIQLGKDGNFFSMMFKLDVDFTKELNDLVINLKAVSISDVQLEEEHLTGIFDILEVENVTGASFKVENFFEAFGNADIEITDIKIANNLLLLEFEGIEIGSMLDEIETTVNNPKLNDSINNIKDKADDPNEEITEEDIEELLEAVEELTEAEKQALQDIISDYFGNLP